MSCSPEELRKRSDALTSSWRAFLAAPGFDLLLEFAVSISSFTEFLHGKGLSGLHLMSRNLEQQALTLVEAGASASIAPATLTELDQRVQELALRMADFIDVNCHPVAERRAQAGSAEALEIAPRHRVWLFGSSGAAWQELALQLGYFNIDAQFQQIRNLPTLADEPAIVLFNATGLTSPQMVEQIKQLREQLSAATLLVLPGVDVPQAVQLLDRIRADFSQIRHPFNETWCTATLSAGVSGWSPPLSAEALIKQADEALYTAKREGRNRTISWQ